MPDAASISAWVRVRSTLGVSTTRGRAGSGGLGCGLVGYEGLAKADAGGGQEHEQGEGNSESRTVVWFRLNSFPNCSTGRQAALTLRIMEAIDVRAMTEVPPRRVDCFHKYFCVFRCLS